MKRNLLRRQQFSKTSPDACSEKVLSGPKSDQNSFKMCRETRIVPEFGHREMIEDPSGKKNEFDQKSVPLVSADRL